MATQTLQSWLPATPESLLLPEGDDQGQQLLAGAAAVTAAAAVAATAWALLRTEAVKQ